MTQPTLSELAEQSRKRRELFVFWTPLIAILIVGGVTNARISSAEASIRKLGATEMDVAQMQTEIRYIKAGLDRVEQSEANHHKEVLSTLTKLQDELRYSRVQQSREIPATMKGMMPEPVHP